MRVLVLGGTAEARGLAAELDSAGDQVLSSLAGRVARPRLPFGEVRVGGFGGVDGLRTVAEQHDAVVDATHPFAAQISAHAAAACTQVPLLRLVRPGWSEEPSWLRVTTHADAALMAARLGQAPFLTIGRQSLHEFVGPLAEHQVLARVVDAPEIAVPPSWQVLLDRGPYVVQDEVALMRSHHVDVLVTKDSGGAYTRAKLQAAAALDLPVVVVRRPPVQPGVSTVADVAGAVEWLRSLP